MKKHLLIFIIALLVMTSCSSQKSALSKFVPKGYTIYETHLADLNNDGIEDSILIIKAINKDHIVTNQFNKIVDRNRRGIIILFKKNNGYLLATKNYNCFSSENEDGGNYHPPQLKVITDKGDLIINFNHGRYGHWSYRFRYQNSNFNLIEYFGSSNYGPIINKETTIDFLKKTKMVSENISENPEGGNDDIFKDTQASITISTLLRLSNIKNFDDLKLDY